VHTPITEPSLADSNDFLIGRPTRLALPTIGRNHPLQLLIAFTCLACLWPCDGAAQIIMRWTNKSGEVQFSNVAPGDGWTANPIHTLQPMRSRPAASRLVVEACRSNCVMSRGVSTPSVSNENQQRHQILSHELEIEQRTFEKKTKQLSDLHAIASIFPGSKDSLSTISALSERITLEISMHRQNKAAILSELERLR
jgi:hypothetical protein